MSCEKYPHMFSPFTVKGIEFKNRVFASPVTAGFLVDHGVPTREGIDAYETRARGGFAEVTVTETFIDHDYAWRHDHCINVWEDHMDSTHMEAIVTLTEAIRAHGAAASIQLNHVGAMNHPDTIPGHKNPIGPSAFLREDGIQVEEMTYEQMEQTALRWAMTALNCKTLGFQIINLHGGHGWLLNQFISPRFNHRTDEFGGSMENRARFPIMVCEKIRELCGPDLLLEYRMSGSERMPGGMTLADGIEFAEIIQDHVDLIHVTSGTYLDHVNTKAFSSMFDPHGCNLDLSEAIKAHVHVPVVAVGGFNAPEQIEDAIASGKCDFVAMGRQQFADPAFVNKAMSGREDQIAPCLRCSCFNPLPPDPSKRPVMEPQICTVNPWNGRELRWRQAPKPEGKRRVLVAGGGPSGMYAAYTAAQRGHEVILAEKSDRLGGQLWFTDADTHKESLLRFRKAMEARCRAYGVEIRLNTEVTRELVREIAPDALICAVGSHPFVPPIPGIEHARHAIEMYHDLDQLRGKRVVMIGGGAIGCESGYFFADGCGADVTILEQLPVLCRDSEPSQRIALLPRMEKIGMKSFCSVSVREILPDGVRYLDADGTEQFAEADVILYCCGSRSNADTVSSLRGSAPFVYVTGDAKKARTVKYASYEGFAAAMDII